MLLRDLGDERVRLFELDEMEKIDAVATNTSKAVEETEVADDHPILACQNDLLLRKLALSCTWMGATEFQTTHIYERATAYTRLVGTDIGILVRRNWWILELQRSAAAVLASPILQSPP